MAIIKSYRDNETKLQASKRFFEGKVLKVETTCEDRNWSDTLDYSDYRAATCTWALVWLGEHGVIPSCATPRYPNARPVSQLESSDWMVRHPLTAAEQFAWIDCTNLLSDRYGYSLHATVDENWKQAAFGGPVMWENYLLWQAAQEQLKVDARKLADERLIAEAKLKAAADAKVAVKAAKDAALKSVAEALLTRIPAKGTVVTVNGFTGKIFWTGVSKYRNAWNANAGVKDAKGLVQWVSASMF